MPDDYRHLHVVWVKNAVAAERQVMGYLENYRMLRRREFFNVPKEKAIRVMDEVARVVNHGVTPDPERLFDDDEIING